MGYDRAVFSASPPPKTLCPVFNPKTHLTYSTSWVGPDKQVWSLGLDKPSWVVFSEPMFPGWIARLDEQPAMIYPADLALRSVYIPAGNHRLEFLYKPVWLVPLMVGLILWMVISLFYSWYLWIKPNRKTQDGALLK